MASLISNGYLGKYLRYSSCNAYRCRCRCQPVTVGHRSGERMPGHMITAAEVSANEQSADLGLSHRWKLRSRRLYDTYLGT